MNWQPFIQFRCGHDQESWDRLTAEEQKAVYRGSGKQRKALKPEIVEDVPDAEFVICRSISFNVRLVSLEELVSMPVYQRF
jgi:hypothetical protein